MNYIGMKKFQFIKHLEYLVELVTIMKDIGKTKTIVKIIAGILPNLISGYGYLQEE